MTETKLKFNLAEVVTPTDSPGSEGQHLLRRNLRCCSSPGTVGLKTECIMGALPLPNQMSDRLTRKM